MANVNDEHCLRCDRRRDRPNDRPQDIGKPCDICAGTGSDYLGRTCRHLPHDSLQNLDHITPFIEPRP